MQNKEFGTSLILSVLSDYWVLTNIANNKKPNFTGNEHIVTVLSQILNNNGIKSEQSRLLNFITLNFNSIDNYNLVDELFFRALSIRKKSGIPEMSFQKGVDVKSDQIVYNYYTKLEDFFYPNSKYTIEIPTFIDNSYRYVFCDAINGLLINKN